MAFSSSHFWKTVCGFLPLLSSGLILATHAASLDPSKPNIIFIITDDQDVRTNTLDYMPKLHASIAEQGVSFTHFYAPVSLCCPSRVSLLKAQFAHNHNVTYVSGPYGGWETFCDLGHNNDYLPIFLQGAGYETYYTGKLMNGMKTTNIQELPAAGWTNADFLVEPNTYLFYNASFSANGEASINYEGEYQTDLIQQKSTSMLQQALASPSQPFFLGIAPTAPHLEVQFNGSFTEPLPSPEYAGSFNGTIVPRSPNYNVPVGGPGGGVSWLKELAELNDTVVDYIDHVYRQRLRSLQSVDDLVENIVQQVEDAGIANNTYIIYVADNGYALGSHRRQPSKTLPFEEDVLIPLFIRGPGITPNTTNSADVYSMPDLGATLLSLAGATTNYTIDGRPISFTETNDTTCGLSANETVQEPRHTITEYWNIGAFEGNYADKTYSNGGFVNQTYRSLRVIDGEDEWVYGVWCTGERELFNLKTDPYQLTNLAINSNSTSTSTFSFATIDDTDYTPLAARLDALLLVLRRCSGNACLSPWSFIFPAGEVQDLDGALDEAYDDYFEGLEKFGYEECRLGFFEEVEGPEWTDALAYTA